MFIYLLIYDIIILGDSMKNEKQLVLFFSKGTKVENTELALKLYKKFELLGEPVVIPFNPNNPAQPLIIFNREKLKLNVSISDISFMYDEEIHKEIYDIVMDIIDFFEELDYSFERMGYISTFLHSKKEKETFKKNIFKEQSIIDSEFQLSWYKKELIDSVSVNVWQKGLTDMINKVELVSIYDINTPMDEVYNITGEFMRDFIKQCDKYIKEKEKEFFD